MQDECTAALNKLELEEGATEDDIKNKYSVLLKKYRYLVQEGMPREDADKELAAVDAAYRLLMGFEGEEADSGSEDGKKGGGGGAGYRIFSAKWFENFLYHYKYRVLGITFIGVLAVMIIIGFAGRPKYDMNISFVGEIYALDIETIKQKITAGTDIIKMPRIDMNSIPNPVENNFHASIRERLTVNMAVGAIDICIIDEPYLKEYCSLGVFMPLDDAIEKSGVDLRKVNLYLLKGKDDDGSERIYGIDVSKSTIFKESGVTGDVMIFAIMENAEHYENCIEMLRILNR